MKKRHSLGSGESLSSSLEELEKQMGKKFLPTGKSMIDLHKAYCREKFNINIPSRLIRQNSKLNLALQRKILKEEMKKNHNNSNSSSDSDSNQKLKPKSGYNAEMIIALGEQKK